MKMQHTNILEFCMIIFFFIYKIRSIFSPARDVLWHLQRCELNTVSTLKSHKTFWVSRAVSLHLSHTHQSLETNLIPRLEIPAGHPWPSPAGTCAVFVHTRLLHSIPVRYEKQALRPSSPISLSIVCRATGSRLFADYCLSTSQPLSKISL